MLLSEAADVEYFTVSLIPVRGWCQLCDDKEPKHIFLKPQWDI